MKLFNVGALRRATDGARISAANDLVQRTLAQHGLAPQVGQTSEIGLPGMPSFSDALSRVGASNGRTAPLIDLKEGAAFTHDTYGCAAGSRAFRTYIPASAADGVTGVVIMLHGCTQTPEDFAAGTGMNQLAEQHRFIVVYPAQSRGNNAQSCWNWFSRGDQRRGVGEPAILAGMTQQICSAHSIGRDRTFVAGLSAGAAMAVILGETYPDVFAAIGAHSGLAYGSANDVPSAFAAMAGNATNAHDFAGASTTIRTIVFHGSSDTTVHPINGDAIVQQAMAKGPSQTIETTENGEAAGRSYVARKSAETTGELTLEHWTVEGLGHAWSGGQSEGSYADPKGPDASAEMIRFFFDTSNKEH